MARRRKTGYSVKQTVLFEPDSEWKVPRELPPPPAQLVEEDLIAIDTETFDPNLKELGPGFLRKDAKVVGFSVATERNQWYYPLHHPEGNYHEPDQAIAWLRDLCALDAPKVFANAQYDVEALWSLGVEVKGDWLDCQVAQPLLNEEQPGGYSLDNLGRVHGVGRKDYLLLREAGASLGIHNQDDIMKHLAYFHPKYVGPYAEQDARVTYDVFMRQEPLLEAEGLDRVFDLETRLLKVLWQMRLRGVPVNLEYAQGLHDHWSEKADKLLMEVREQAGLKVDPWSAQSLAVLVMKLNVPADYPRTEKRGDPSFTNDWLLAHEHPVLNMVGQHRQLTKMCRDFIQGAIFRYELDGRVHSQYHPLRSEEGGTRSGRLASTHPNQQQAPARHPEFGPAYRTIFQPEEGERWLKGDYASQEPRLSVHFCHKVKAPGVQRIVEEYLRNPLLDVHQHVADGMGTISRRDAKDINLGLIYGMQVPKLARLLGLSQAEATLFFDHYFSEFGFFKYTSEKARRTAQRHGYVRTIMGRKSRFHMMDDGMRAGVYRAMNRIIQGSAADMMKQAMVNIYERHDRVPLVTVHDEGDYSVPKRDKSVIQTIRHEMEHAIELVVPVIVDLAVGRSWGELKELK